LGIVDASMINQRMNERENGHLDQQEEQITKGLKGNIDAERKAQKKWGAKLPTELNNFLMEIR
tara:strand:+ start:1449 stop:1637 length:189 start_codon:yes stop_codon:yes gene_type:complete